MTEVKLSKRAQKLYQRLIDGKFYKAYLPSVPKAMYELEKAELVGIAGRSPVIEACYVPYGYENRRELFPHQPPEEEINVGDYVVAIDALDHFDNRAVDGIVYAIDKIANRYTIIAPAGVYEAHSPRKVEVDADKAPTISAMQQMIGSYRGLSKAEHNALFPVVQANDIGEDIEEYNRLFDDNIGEEKEETDIIGMSGYASKADRDIDIEEYKKAKYERAKYEQEAGRTKRTNDDA